MEATQQNIPAIEQPAPQIRYDHQRLKLEIAEQTAAIRETKTILHQPHGPDIWKAQRTIAEQKLRATRLCQIAAHIHGKIHLAGQTAEEQLACIAQDIVGYVRGA